MADLSLGEKQELFMSLLPLLIDKAHDLGFKVRGGELQRSKSQARWNATHCRTCKGTKKDKHVGHTFKSIGIVRSLHIICLAIDLKLMKGGIYLKYSSQYKELGWYWESLHELCCWGGRFRKPDGGHFSIAHGGRQ